MEFGETLDRAFETALARAIALLLDGFGFITAEDAYIFCSLAANYKQQ